MSDLVEFLLARLDEDQSEIVEHPDDPFDPDGYQAARGGGSRFPLLAIGKRRALRDVEAKRKIVHTCDYVLYDEDQMVDETAIATLRLLALPYQDHPDYREEWKP